MSAVWKLRHAGSPQTSNPLTAEEIVQGVQDEIFDPTDEVRGPNDKDWVPLEQHPHFAEAMANIEPPEPPPHEDETRLDMNPLIDVALVLLIFFMLTTVYEELRKKYPFLQDPQEEKASNPQPVNDAKKIYIFVTLKQEGDKTLIYVDDTLVPEDNLTTHLRDVRTRTARHAIGIDIGPTVPWGAVMSVQDSAKEAEIGEIRPVRRVRKE
jgi:biopolymer transport protein ExbD